MLNHKTPRLEAVDLTLYCGRPGSKVLETVVFPSLFLMSKTLKPGGDSPGSRA